MLSFGVSALSEEAQSRLLEAGTYGPVLASAAAKATPAQQATLVTAPQNRAQMVIMNEQQAALYSKQYLDEWNRFQPAEVAGSTVLILGLGSIGQAVRRRLEALRAEVIGVAREARPGVHGADELPGLLPRADAVVVLAPLTDDTRGMVDADFLGALPNGALLLNAARGAVVDTDALVAELASGRLQAVLDVTDPEPLPSDHPLWDAPGLLALTPHVAGDTPGGEERALRFAATQLARYARGEPLRNVVVQRSVRAS